MSTTTYPASQKQLDFIVDLGRKARQQVNALPEGDKRTGYSTVLDVLAREVKGGIDSRKASQFIDALKELIADTPHVRPHTQREADEMEAGMYQHEGTIYRVYLGQRSGRMLVKQVVGDEATGYSYEYLGAAAYKLPTAATRMTLDEAKHWGKMTGHCCVCARRLDNPESVDAGIGPVCAGRMDQ